MPVLNCIDRCLSFIDVAIKWVQWASKYAQQPTSGYLFLRHHSGFKKITIESIKYLEASSNYCKFYLTNSTAMVVTIPLLEVAKYLPSDHFIRVHRSFSVNFLHVDGFTGNTLVMEGGIKLPIGRQYRKSVIESFPLLGTKSRKYTL